MMRGLAHAFALLGLAMLLGAGPAAAHKMKVFAAADGAEIAGYVYFSPGADRGVQVAIAVSDGTGATVYSGTTDEEGTFRFSARTRSDHRIEASGTDGHAASYLVSAAELPESLPPAGVASVAAAVSSPPEPAAPTTAAGPAAAELRAIVDRSVAQQLRPLREQIDGWYEKIWWHDILGGLGYIIGLAGLAYGLARRPNKGGTP